MIQYNKIFLKPLSREDIPACMQQFSPAVQQALHVQSSAAEQEYLERLAGLPFTWVVKTDDTIVGLIAVRDRANHKNQGQLYSWINENYWGMGAYQSALAQASENYFEQTNDLYYTAHVDVDNIRSYKALKKAGFADYAISEGAHGKQFELILRNKKGS